MPHVLTFQAGFRPPVKRFHDTCLYKFISKPIFFCQPKWFEAEKREDWLVDCRLEVLTDFFASRANAIGGNMVTNKLVEWKALIDSVGIKAADLEDKFLF